MTRATSLSSARAADSSAARERRYCDRSSRARCRARARALFGLGTDARELGVELGVGIRPDARDLGLELARGILLRRHPRFLRGELAQGLGFELRLRLRESRFCGFLAQSLQVGLGVLLRLQRERE